MRSSLPSYENQNVARRPTSADRHGSAGHGSTGRLAGEGRENHLSSGSEWRMQLSASQLVVLWSILAGVMILVFLFGLYAGREQGLNAALEEYRQSGARIPIADPQAFAESSQEMLAALDHTATTELKAAPGSSASATASSLDSNTGGSATGTAGGSTAGGSTGSGVAASGAAKETFDFSEEGKVSRSALAQSDSVAASVAPAEVPAGGLALFKSDAAEPSTTGPSSSSESKAATLDAERKAAELKAAEAKAAQQVAERQKQEREAAKSATKAEVAAGKVANSAPKSDAVAAKQSEKTQAPVRAAAPTAGPTSGWYVQIAATRAQNQADDIVDQSRRQGFDPVIEVATVRESKYFRVLIGPYQTRELALNAKDEAKRKALSRTEPFLKRIK